MQREGVFREMKRRRFFEKPSERSTREKADAVRRARKLAIWEGLIAAPKKAVFQLRTFSTVPWACGSAILDHQACVQARTSKGSAATYGQNNLSPLFVEREGRIAR